MGCGATTLFDLGCFFAVKHHEPMDQLTNEFYTDLDFGTPFET